jgi:hypothetical protein
MGNQKLKSARVLFPRLLIPLRASEALGFFAACLAFLNVVSALAVSHKASTLTLSAPVPSCFAFGVWTRPHPLTIDYREFRNQSVLVLILIGN